MKKSKSLSDLKEMLEKETITIKNIEVDQNQQDIINQNLTFQKEHSFVKMETPINDERDFSARPKEYIEKKESVIEGQLEMTNKRLYKTQCLMDEILYEIFLDVPKQDVKNFERKTIRVFRGSKLYFGSCDCSFRYLNKIFYVIFHSQDQDQRILIEQEFVLRGYNSCLQTKQINK